MTRATRTRTEHSIVTKEIAPMPSLSRPAPRTTSFVSGLLSAALAALAMLTLAAPAAQAAPGPAWSPPVMYAAPTNLEPSSSPLAGTDAYVVSATNVGGAPTSGPVTFTDTLPEGMTVGGHYVFGEGGDGGITGYKKGECTKTPPRTLTCTYAEPVEPGNYLELEEFVTPDGSLTEGTQVTNQFAISGGGAPEALATAGSTFSTEDAPFDFLEGLNGLNGALTGVDGLPDTQAGSHPGSLSVNFGVPVRATGFFVSLQGADGGARDVHVTLPPGAIVNPNATPVRCTEVELESYSCPPASQIGLAQVQTLFGPDVLLLQESLYNMVAPHGQASAFAFDVAALGLFQHILGGVQPGDYGAGNYAESAGTNDILSLWYNPILGLQVQFWGNPSSSIYDYTRGECHFAIVSGDCPVEAKTTPVLTNPTACSDSLTMRASADSWGHPGDFRSTSSPVTDSLGNPTGADGCSGLNFDPSLQARPTTNQADSPSGLSVDLHIPQTNDLSTLATANLRKAVVTLPEGLTLNPASANGLEGCSSAQIGIDPSTGVPDGNQPSCPDASRIGDVEVDTPLLPEALQGSVYVATPFDNPFSSLLAIYVVVNDPATGVLIKLAGHVVPDPDTGRLVTSFDDNPQLPFSDFKLDFFGGAGGVLRTPAVCGNYSTTSELTPWSAPESGPPAAPKDEYAISAGCSASVASEPNKPEFEAGTVSPIAGKYTPFNVHLKREDGSQQFKTLTLSPPPGLTAKLAGTPACSDGALASAAAKSGKDEQANPSCGASSRIGSVTVGAGAGPAPYYAKGTAYLAGPYKGAPLSMAIITPAVAGPFDLGTVVTRVALHVNPANARITADADPIPSILEGIPLDVRSVDVSLDKPGFTRTGTSCDPFSVDGQLVSTLGQGAALQSRYQLGNCANLAFKPRLAIFLKGGTKRGKNPALIATLSAKEGEADIASTAVTLPHSAFLDQSHIKTVCTRVQFAAGAGNGAECPAGSIYGTASAKTPLLDYTLTGNAYLRSSSHKLPDLVVALQGPPSQPIAIELDGRTDSVKGALRNTFEAVPDAPVSSFRLMLFGGKRGLVVNSRNLCAHTYRASVAYEAQSGALFNAGPKVKTRCPKAHKRHKRNGHR